MNKSGARPETQQQQIQLIIPAEYRYLHLISTVIETLLQENAQILQITEGITEEFIYFVKLATHEICNNIVEHAYEERAGTVRVNAVVDQENSLIVIEIDDTGRPFDSSEAHEPTLEEAQEKGYGLFLAKELMDDVTYSRHATGNHWQLTKSFAAENR